MNQEHQTNMKNNLIPFAAFEDALLKWKAIPFDDVFSENSGNYFKGFYVPFSKMVSFYAFSNLTSKKFKFVIEPTINHSKYKDEFRDTIIKLNRLASSSERFPFSDLVLDREYKGTYKNEFLDISQVLFQSPKGSVGIVSSVLAGGACSQLAKYNQGIGNASAVEHVLNRLELIFSYADNHF